MRQKLISGAELPPPALRQVTLRVAAKADGINLSQGTCNLTPPRALFDGLESVLSPSGDNRYCPADGIPLLKAAIRDKLEEFNQVKCENSNVMVTSGATGAFEAVCDCFLEGGDEVVVFSPAYPYHIDKLRNRGASLRRVKLSPPDWSFSFRELEEAIRPNTKMILLCNPSNPTGKVFTKDELIMIGNAAQRVNAICVTDEVYEYITYDQNNHTSLASLPGMFNQTITIGSFSKTFSITGWRIGYMCAPHDVTSALKASLDHKYVCPVTPLQYGVAHALKTLTPEYYSGMRSLYSDNRDILCKALVDAGLTPFVPQGSYYVIAATRNRFPNATSQQVVDLLIESKSVGAVPATDFIGREFANDPTINNFLRFNFAHPRETIVEAANRIRTI
jgi:aminotransferase